MTYSPYIAWTKPPGVASLGDIVRALRRGAAEALPAGVSIILDETGSQRVAGLASSEVWATRGLATLWMGWRRQRAWRLRRAAIAAHPR